MINIDTLPVPDWGLQCPHCCAPLAGLPMHVCGRCRRPFRILHVVAAHRPIVDLDLRCDECDYLLTGLMDKRCPECGTEFDLREMLEDRAEFGLATAFQATDPEDHHVKKREPTFTGGERPLPDFGLVCSQCDSPLAGATGDACSQCHAEFDLMALLPDRELVNLTAYVPKRMAPVAKMVLYDAQVPYLVNNDVLAELYAMQEVFSHIRLLTFREFFFDALHAFAEAEAPPPQYVNHEWTCPNCSETIPPGFEICWSCQTPHPPDPGREAS